jgi:hypothetical protein
VNGDSPIRKHTRPNPLNIDEYPARFGR